MATDSKQNPVLRARNGVINDLIAAHEAEYHDRMEKACADLGVTYSRPLSAEEKARKDVAALLEKYPNLRDQFAPGTFPEEGEVSPEADDGGVTKSFST